MADDGSSPRVRGTERISANRPCESRFIPACAGNSKHIESGHYPNPVHPRVCGEQICASVNCVPSAGSSPRVRGTGIKQSGRQTAGRFIPACAGNSENKPVLSCLTPVHPRVCGEQVVCRPQNPSRIGSSPRVRGTEPCCLTSRDTRRFIPACAGNRVGNWDWERFAAVHPRVCGEQSGQGRKTGRQSGSSPRVRGTVTRTLTRHICLRFIPACAGNSAFPFDAKHWPPVHPRVCGEQTVDSCLVIVLSGSSPRVRGTADHLNQLHVCLRFIPACAGNSAWRGPEISRRPVHPRVCGEQFSLQSRSLCFSGSSPRVRGTAESSLHAAERKRFIPACAGNRSPTGTLRIRQSVHPRVCGEQRGIGLFHSHYSGSSPRVRGTDELHIGPVLLILRFIPACAGNR